MKFLVLFLISFSAFAGSPSIELIGKEKAKKLNALYTQVDSFCDNQGYHADLVVECKSSKDVIKSQFGAAILALVDFERLKGVASARDIQNENDCIKKYKAIFEEKKYPLPQNQKCNDFELAFKALEPPQE